MKKRTLVLLVGVLLIAVLAVGAFSAWSVVNHANNNVFQAATFDMTINGQHDASGVCGVTNWAPGDPPVVCRIPLHNGGSIPINVVWSGFALNGDAVMADNILVTEFSDSTGSTQLSDLGLGINPKLSAVAPVLANGYFSNGSNTHGVFIPAGGDGYVQITLAFKADAGNDTIGKQATFAWTLTAMQTPVNTAP